MAFISGGFFGWPNGGCRSDSGLVAIVTVTTASNAIRANASGMAMGQRVRVCTHCDDLLLQFVRLLGREIVKINHVVSDLVLGRVELLRNVVPLVDNGGGEQPKQAGLSQ